MLSKALEDVEIVVHLVAETGTGQSMYEISRYFDVNIQGTANLLDAIQNSKFVDSVKKLVVASSRAAYGEGSYKCSQHGIVFPEPRSNAQMTAGDFDLYCPQCSKLVEMVATEEATPFRPLSFYALTKQAQEQAVLMYAQTRGLDAFALRYQNVYGEGQSLKNPYTGILAIFSNLARQGQSINVFEDGLESRDFVYIEDVAEATLCAVMHDDKFVGALNVGSGEAISVMTVAEEINRYFGSRSNIQITGEFRAGDIRHNKADTKKIESLMNFFPSISFKEGLHRFLAWTETQTIEGGDAFHKSLAELNDRGLIGRGKQE